MKVIFVVGTNTGIGKTTIARSLIAYLATQNYRVSGFKPVETGCAISETSTLPIAGLAQAEEQDVQTTQKAREALKRLQALTGVTSSINLDAPNADLTPRDGEHLRLASNTAPTIDTVNPYRYAAPVAPSVAARLAKRPITVADLMAKMRAFENTVDYLVVEGAGGLLVPLNATELMIDFITTATDANSPYAASYTSVLVGASSLGTINHCLLSLEALSHRDIHCAGVILNRLEKALKPEEASNPDQIELFSRTSSSSDSLETCPVLGVFPYLEKLDDCNNSELARRINVHVDLAPVTTHLGTPQRQRSIV